MDKVSIKKSNIRNGGFGLFADVDINEGEYVVTYYGDKIDMEGMYNIYINNREKYEAMNKYIRGTPHGYVIYGIKSRDIRMCGVYVNDIDRIKCDKNNININIINKYKKSVNRCNLRVDDRGEYPIYISNRKIRRGEELYVHYGVGYWLQNIGFSPEEISEINNKYDIINY